MPMFFFPVLECKEKDEMAQKLSQNEMSNKLAAVSSESVVAAYQRHWIEAKFNGRPWCNAKTSVPC